MFPVGCATGCMQAAIEGENDVTCLLHARSKSDTLYREAVSKYVAIGVLAYADVLSEIGGKARRIVQRHDADAEPLVLAAQREAP